MAKIPYKHYFLVLIAGIIFAVLNQGFGYLVWEYLFGDQIKNIQGLWRDMNSAEVRNLPPIASLIAGLAVACLVSKIPLSEKCCCPYMRGICIGFKIFLIAGLANAIMWYAYSPIPKVVFNASVIHHLLSFVLGTVVVSRIVGESAGWCETSGSKSKKK